MRRTEALASVKFYQILSIFIFFIRLIILEDFIRLISYNGPCVRLGCSFFLATVTHVNFNHVNQIEVRHKVLRLNVKLSEFLLLRLHYCTCDLSYIAFILFANANFTHVRT